MAFGDNFLPRSRNDAESEVWIGSEVERNWNVSGMGDCAVGIWSGGTDIGRLIPNDEIDASGSGPVEVRLVEGTDFEDLLQNLGNVKWVGYVGVRDCTTRLPPRTAEDPALPPWEEMIELRYGFAPDVWGTGYGTEAARGLMLWATSQMGVRRFIAETEIKNRGSGNILRKLGFVQRDGSEYWKNPLEIEWEKKIGRG